MSEVLASLRQKGGDNSIDLMSPDVEYTNGSMANNATASIAITQMPRYVIFFIDSAPGTTFAWYGIYDVKNDVYMRAGYYGSSIRSWDTWGGATNYITSVTSSAVSVKNTSSVTCRMVVEIYY